VEKCSTVRQATDGSRAHVHCMLENQSHTYTLSICNAVRIAFSWQQWFN